MINLSTQETDITPSNNATLSSTYNVHTFKVIDDLMAENSYWIHIFSMSKIIRIFVIFFHWRTSF